MIRDPLALGALVALLVALGFWLERSFGWARKVGPSLLIIALGAILSNFDAVPESSPVYDLLTGPVTSLAIVWLLFAVDLRQLRVAGPRMLMMFGIGVLATALAATAGTLVAAGTFGDDTWRLAGVLTGTYSGGSLNFVAVGREVGLEAELYAAATAADNVVTALWMGVCLLLPATLARFFVTGPSEEEGAAPERQVAELRPYDLAALLALGLLVVGAAQAITASWPQGWLKVPSVIWLTTIALVLAQLRPIRALAGALELGTVALHLFFAVIGIFSRIDKIVAVGPEVFFLTLAVVGGHGLLLFGFAYLVRADLKTTTVASIAAIGGPSTAMALAVSKGWKGLVLPGLIAGLLGYAVGTYVGLGVAWLVRVSVG